MSMLAEPRRRQKIGPNPRGKFFTEDEDNKGRSLLQKMGWKSGDGLGVQRQGIKDPIRPKIQTDEKGLGFDVKSDPWVSHTDDFNELLKNLQTVHGGLVKEKTPKSELPTTPGFPENPKPSRNEDKLGLESKSKISRSRIHYHKFVKNKDLSNIKDKDWGCIFGKSEGSAVASSATKSEDKTKSSEMVSKNWGDMLAQKEYCINDRYEENGDMVSSTTIPVLDRVQRYKAQMMRSFAISTLPEDQPKSFEEHAITENTSSSTDEPSKKKKKKDKKHKKMEEEEECVVVAEDAASNEQKKKKKDKQAKTDEQPITELLEFEHEEVFEKKKKKLKKQRLDDKPCVETEPVAEDAELSKKKRKKNKDKQKLDDKPCVETEAVAEDAELSKKKRKKNKDKQELEDNCPSTTNFKVSELSPRVDCESETITEDVLDGAEPKQKKAKKNKKSDASNTCKPEITENIINCEMLSKLPDTPAVANPIETVVDDTPTRTRNFNRRSLSAEEFKAAALVFKGSNLLQISGYRNQSNKLL